MESQDFDRQVEILSACIGSWDANDLFKQLMPELIDMVKKDAQNGGESAAILDKTRSLLNLINVQAAWLKTELEREISNHTGEKAQDVMFS